MKNEQVSVRLPPALLNLLDAYAAKLDKERPGTEHGRSGALKVLLATCLPGLVGPPAGEQSAAPASPKTGTSPAKRTAKRPT